jgi:hypothetical protein
MQADHTQGEFLKRVFEAQIKDEAEAMLEQIRAEQAAKVHAKNQRERRVDLLSIERG